MVLDLGRVFGARVRDSVRPEISAFLRECFSGPTGRVQPTDYAAMRSDETVDWLLKVGALLEVEPESGVFTFATPLARRYFAKLAFPDRAADNPGCVRELVERAIQRMSASKLATATLPSAAGASAFPKETTFQREFRKGLMESTSSSCSVCDDLSRTSGEPHPNDGELDFYVVNGELRWGVELLVGGDRIGEHMRRFGPEGRYKCIDLHDYMVVDFRQSAGGQPTRVMACEKKITVFFSADGNFTRCTCLFETDTQPLELTLSP